MKSKTWKFKRRPGDGWWEEQHYDSRYPALCVNELANYIKVPRGAKALYVTVVDEAPKNQGNALKLTLKGWTAVQVGRRQCPASLLTSTYYALVEFAETVRDVAGSRPSSLWAIFEWE